MKYDFDAAIFDLDGTLLDSQRYWRYTALDYLLAHGIPFTREDLLRMNGTSSRKLLMEIAEREGLDIDRDGMIREIEGFMDRHYRLDAPLKTPSVPAFLEELRRSGVRMCVATVSPCDSISVALERVGIRQYFEFIFKERSGKQAKNDPDYFLEVAGKLGAAPERCWVFEDALNAVRSAKAAGLKVCAIEEVTSRDDREAIMALADRYIKDYSEWM